MAIKKLPAPLTVVELARRGYALESTVVRILADGSKKEDTRWEIRPYGLQLLRENQAARAEWLRSHPDEAREAVRAAIVGGRNGTRAAARTRAPRQTPTPNQTRKATAA